MGRYRSILSVYGRVCFCLGFGMLWFMSEVERMVGCIIVW